MLKALHSIDDQNPTRLLRLLRSLAFERTANPLITDVTDKSMLVNPSDSYYVRNFVVREARETFANWRGRQADSLPWEDGEGLCCSDACHYLPQLSDSDKARWVHDLYLGAYKILKTILMAFLPKLESLTFVQNYVNIVPVRPDTQSLLTLPSLTFALRQLSSLPQSNWPCFQCLKDVTIGISSEGYTQSSCYKVKDAAPLLLLPSVVDLRLNRVVDDGEPYSWEWESRISSCESLSFQRTERMCIDSISGLLGGVKNIKRLVLGGRDWSQNSTFAEYLLEHGRDSLEYIQVSPPLEFAYQAMFKQLSHVEIPLWNLVDSVQTTLLFSDSNKQRLHAQNWKNTRSASTWIDLASKLSPSVETIKLVDTEYPLYPQEAISLVKVLENVVKAKLAHLPRLRGLCVVEVTSEFAHPEWAARRRRQFLPAATIQSDTQALYESEAERRQAGIHYWCTDLRLLAARSGVEIHTNPVEACVGPRSTLFCHFRDCHT
jgi:hypothetical protein